MSKKIIEFVTLEDDEKKVDDVKNYLKLINFRYKVLLFFCYLLLFAIVSIIYTLNNIVNRLGW